MMKQTQFSKRSLKKIKIQHILGVDFWPFSKTTSRQKITSITTKKSPGSVCRVCLTLRARSVYAKGAIQPYSLHLPPSIEPYR